MNRVTMTVSEAAKYIGVCEDTIYNMVREKEAIDTWMNQEECRAWKAPCSP